MARKNKKKPGELVDILDHNNHRLAVLSRKEARYQGLRHRLVLVTMGDSQGKVCIRKRGSEKRIYPNRLDIMASGHVRSGEAISEAASRHLFKEAGIATGRMDLIQTITPGPETDYRLVSFFSGGRIKQPEEISSPEFGSLMFLNQEELGHLVLEMPEMLTPFLIFAWNEKLLFSFF